jgi:Fur family peroxide stress response transcriptional regulator
LTWVRGSVRVRVSMHAPRVTNPLSPRQLDFRLRQAGARPTPQRRAVYAALSERCDHPTAETLYRQVRRRMRALSRATVYNALDLLVRGGAAQRLTHADGTARYDARVDGHDHLHCLACGRVDDLDRPEQQVPFTIRPDRNFTVTGYRLELVGYCAACAGRQTIDSTQPLSLEQGDSR